jgi:hypothetical protein
MESVKIESRHGRQAPVNVISGDDGDIKDTLDGPSVTVTFQTITQ